jgi:hypothetical protein
MLSRDLVPMAQECSDGLVSASRYGLWIDVGSGAKPPGQHLILALPTEIHCDPSWRPPLAIPRFSAEAQFANDNPLDQLLASQRR